MGAGWEGGSGGSGAVDSWGWKEVKKSLHILHLRLASLLSLTGNFHAAKIGRFLGMVMHDNKLKQEKIKFTCRPRIKLNHNIHVYINTQLFQERLSEKLCTQQS